MSVVKMSDITNVYKTTYNNTERVLIPLEIKDLADTVLCWDFTIGEYRRFKNDKLNAVTNITDKCVVIDHHQARIKYSSSLLQLQQHYQDRGYSTYVTTNDRLYVVKV